MPNNAKPVPDSTYETTFLIDHNLFIIKFLIDGTFVSVSYFYHYQRNFINFQDVVATTSVVFV